MRLLALIPCLVFMGGANAATYYVDSSSGNDAWSGKIANPNGSPGTDGPWLTLTKVSAASLVAGDTVLLKCGQRWNQTLSIRTSGTAANPITFGVYPTSCATPPQINGATSIPASNWKLHSGKIYKATLPLNLVSNSTFDTGVSGWTKWSSTNDATLAPSTSCPTGAGKCMSFVSGSTPGIVSSNAFALSGSAAYTLKAMVKVPAGKTIRAVVRRNASPWDQVGVSAVITGNGAWQSYSFPFTSKISLTNARVDFEAASGLSTGIDNVRVEATVSGVLGVFDGGRVVNVAHHPNRGYDPTRPESLYYSIAQDSDKAVVSGKTVSTFLTMGADLEVPSGATLTPGTGVRIRAYDYRVDERKIASISGTRINLDQPTSLPLYKGWGYFLTGHLWMLDESGESFFDASSNTVYVWMSDSNAPGDRVSVGQLDAAIDISNASYLVVQNIAVRNSSRGVRLYKANNVTLRDLIIEDTIGRGIDATQSALVEISTSKFARTGRAAISGKDLGWGLSGFSVHDNDISESGVVLQGGKVISLPADVVGAVQPGADAAITRNRIRATSYSGIMPQNNSVVSDNHVENSCLVLDDGGSIYLSRASSNSLVDHNMVIRAVGSKAGKPANHYTQAQGIFLDDFANNVTVSNNTVVDANDGILLHNAFNNRIENNTLYGNRRYQLLLQEHTGTLRPDGDIYDNVISGNRLFQTGSLPAVRHETWFSSTADFASYDNNRYFTLASPIMAAEASATALTDHTFSKWQDATAGGTPRYLDPNGSEVNSSTIGYAAYKGTGGNIVPNGNLAAGKTGWSAWNQTAPRGILSLINCPPGQCLKYVAGGSAGIVSSPNFSVAQGKWYRLTFDLQGSVANQAFHALVRRGGGGANGYESLMTPVSGVATTDWKRYSLFFQSIKTVKANDPVTGDLGARVDFSNIQPGQGISIANVELVPISALEASLRTNILVNPDASATSLDCPLSGTDASFCSQFVRFTDGQPVSWPYPLGAGDSEIIYTLDQTLTDADRDGITDSQDTCAATPAGQSVNAKGCSFAQSHP